jgi:hypothetical protein
MPVSPDQESGLDRVVAAVNRLTGEALFDPSVDENASKNRATIHHDPL